MILSIYTANKAYSNKASYIPVNLIDLNLPYVVA